MIGIIAGTGNLPIEACVSLLQQKKQFFIIPLFPEDNLQQLESVTKKQIPIFPKTIAKASDIIKTLQSQKTTQVLLIGKVDKRNLLKKIKFDWFGIKFFARITCQSDKTIMEAILAEFKKLGISILSQKDVLGNLTVPPGILTGKINEQLKENIEFGIKAAENISHYDIGQTVVVKDKMILAVEAIEGTDNCIKRGIEIGKEDVVICKGATHTQSKKYDLPTLGPQSLENLRQGQVKAIAWQSSQTFVIQKEEFVARAKKLKITLVSM